MSTNSPFHEFHHEIRQSSVILIAYIFLIEVIMILLHFIIGKILIVLKLHNAVGFGLSAMTWEIIIFHILNIAVIFMAIIAWTNTSYTLTPWIVSFTQGILRRKRISYEIYHIESASVKQGIFGRIFDYGTVQIKSPYFDNDVFLKRIPSPHHLVQTIENQRLYDESLGRRKTDVTYFKKT